MLVNFAFNFLQMLGLHLLVGGSLLLCESGSFSSLFCLLRANDIEVTLDLLLLLTLIMSLLVLNFGLLN